MVGYIRKKVNFILDSKTEKRIINRLRSVGGHVFEGDLYKALPHSLKGHVNILVANVPYVPTEAIELLPQEARLYVPVPTFIVYIFSFLSEIADRRKWWKVKNALFPNYRLDFSLL